MTTRTKRIPRPLTTVRSRRNGLAIPLPNDVMMVAARFANPNGDLPVIFMPINRKAFLEAKKLDKEVMGLTVNNYMSETAIAALENQDFEGEEQMQSRIVADPNFDAEAEPNLSDGEEETVPAPAPKKAPAKRATKKAAEAKPAQPVRTGGRGSRAKKAQDIEDVL